MIYLVHENNEVIKVVDKDHNQILSKPGKSITDTLFRLAEDHPNELIIWSHVECFDFINSSGLDEIFHHKGIMASYTINDYNFIPDEIGYVDQYIYIKVNKEVTYPTWLMSSDIGGIHAELLNTIFNKVKRNKSFDYFINSLAKTAMPQGLFCYSEPRLLVSKPKFKKKNKASISQLFRFVKEQYKVYWVFILFTSCLLFDKRFLLVPLLKSLFYSRHNHDFNFNLIDIQSTRNVIDRKEVDVVIPTFGRKHYLLNTLKDLARQTILPKNVIIVEQNPDKNSQTDLDYIKNRSWPFKIKHKFIHQTGVCNARNIALGEVTSEWTFLGDDDIQFEKDLIEKAFNKIDKYGVMSINTVCLQPGEIQIFNKTSQTPIFGSGTSFVKSELLSRIKFDMNFEFNYGEDSDFGMQIRNQGQDVIFISDVKITHLKAPVGGYRIGHKNEWDDEIPGPKPSPTIMVFNQKYFTDQQLLGYKVLLFIKYFKSQSIRNPFRYISVMNSSWNSSLFWSQKIREKENA